MPRLLLLSLLSLLRLTASSIVDPLLFDKESGLDTEFPPDMSVLRDDDSTPVGHLRCFGHQSDSDGAIPFIPTPASPRAFFDLVSDSKPIIFNDSSVHSAPIAALTDADLSQDHGHLQVHFVPIVRHRPAELTLTDSFQSFLASYRKRDEYLASTLPPSMAHLFPLPRYLRCGPLAKRLTEAELWMAWGGTGSLLHYHAEHQLHCMLDGRKDFVFIEAKYKKEFRCREVRPGSGEGVSTIDMESLNMYTDAHLAKIPWTHVSAFKGQCVYIPAGVMHHVRSYGRALAFKLHFSKSGRVGSETFDDCAGADLTGERSLQDANFVWSIRDGEEQLSDEKLTATSLAAVLSVVTGEKDEMSRDQFVAFIDRAVTKAKNRKDEYPSGNQLFNLLDTEARGVLKMDKLDESKLQRVAEMLNKIHIPRHTEL